MQPIRMLQWQLATRRDGRRVLYRIVSYRIVCSARLLPRASSKTACSAMGLGRRDWNQTLMQERR